MDNGPDIICEHADLHIEPHGGELGVILNGWLAEENLDGRTAFLQLQPLELSNNLGRGDSGHIMNYGATEDDTVSGDFFCSTVSCFTEAWLASRKVLPSREVETFPSTGALPGSPGVKIES